MIPVTSHVHGTLTTLNIHLGSTRAHLARLCSNTHAVSLVVPGHHNLVLSTSLTLNALKPSYNLDMRSLACKDIGAVAGILSPFPGEKRPKQGLTGDEGEMVGPESPMSQLARWKKRRSCEKRRQI